MALTRSAQSAVSAALDPSASSIVEACAGSGKTWLLTARMVRLLLDGAAPGEILAITFTRKGAQEIEQRLREWLSRLVLGSDHEVCRFLVNIGVAEPQVDASVQRARGLLERYLTAQPGITISTFHAWFLQLLRRAPFSSALAGEITLLERTSALMEEAWQALGDQSQRDPGGEIATSLQRLFREYGLFNTRKLLFAFVGKRAEWWAYTLGERDPPAYALARLLAELGIDPSDDVRARLVADPGFVAGSRELAQLLARNTGRDQQLGRALEAALQSGTAQVLFEACRQACLTETGEPRKRAASNAQCARLGAQAEARLLHLHQQLSERLLAAQRKLAEQAAYAANVAGLRCGAALLEQFQKVKRARGAIDYTDVEWQAFLLLNHSASAEYMQYKLDARYRHILVDEFQDTNPLQWQVLSAWLTASADADLRPSVFMVGDPKQAIYRFRRAEARLFELAAQFFQREFGAVRGEQHVSRRNAPAILQLVNRLFQSEPEFRPFTAHQALQADLPGRVELLPLLPQAGLDVAASAGAARSPTNEATPLRLRNPLLEPLLDELDRRREREAQQLVVHIKRMVKRWVVHGDDGKPRALRYGDVMLLTRSRTHLAIYERELRRAQIPCVSSDYGGLLATLEARDLAAVLGFLVTPFADLQLAHALKSPLFGCDDEDLMRLALVGEGDWWQRLQRLCDTGDAGAALSRACILLRSWLARADRLPVHDLLDRIYFEGELASRYEASVPATMRAAVAANLRAFMELALSVDAGRYPSLPGFLDQLAELRKAASEEAPDEGLIEDSTDGLRIHTIHGAKGLEAPVVWLIDANAAGRVNESFGVLLDWKPEAAAPEHFSLYTLAAERGVARAPRFGQEQTQAQREDLNLLYVALTRAKQAVLLSGCESDRAAGSWYEKVERALNDCGAARDAASALCLGASLESAERPFDEALQTAEAVTPAAGPVASAAAALAVGSRDESIPSVAQRRGVALHSILQRIGALDAIPDAEQLRHSLNLSEAEFTPLWQRALDLVRAPLLSRYFDSALYLSAANELPYIPAGGETRRIDRLVEFADSVCVLDYKSASGGRVDAAAVAAHRAQLEAYCAAMRAAYPRKKVNGVLVFADGTVLELTGCEG